MIEQNNEIMDFTIDQIPEEQNIQDIIYNLMADPNLAPINYFNDFSEESVDVASMSNDETDETGIFSSENGQLMAMTTHALHHHLEIDPSLRIERIWLLRGHCIERWYS